MTDEKDKKIRELEAEVSRLKDELIKSQQALVNALSGRTAIQIPLPCTRPHSDEYGPWVAPYQPYKVWW